ncbi:thioredoxin family protein [Salibacterium aidingense]|uniref:thioredoxin family protein n=1 Tax=Salibacterium aidingense TaxID=384933 RepID=UPI00042584E7|nr:thioredoxin family protein [Salibacterium aidingense]
MITSANIKEKLGHGVTPQEFMESMNHRYRATLDQWHELFTWDDHDREALAPLKDNTSLRCAVLAGDWCGDVHRSLGPVLEVMKEADIPVELFIMEKHDDLMGHFLTMGGRSVPKVIVTNPGGDVLFTWGPRPAYIQEPMTEFKRQNYAPDDPQAEEAKKAAYEGIHARYGKDSGYQKLVVYELTNQLLQL